MLGEEEEVRRATPIIKITSAVTQEDESKPYKVYYTEIIDGTSKWTELKRYNQFLELHRWLATKYPDQKLTPFPPKTWIRSKAGDEITYSRKIMLEKYLQAVVANPILFETYQVRFFLGIKKKTQGWQTKRILAPLPDTDFDPTEIAVPWKLMTFEGWQVVFATEMGTVAQADPLLVRKGGVMFGQFGADPEPRSWYKEMEKDEAFLHPITWESIEPGDYDAVILTGGHAQGMKQYLEDKTLQQKIGAFWDLNRIVGAICHGTLLLARTESTKTKNSVLSGRKTSCLPKYLENMGYYLTRWTLGNYYRTYEVSVEDEVKKAIGDERLYDKGPMTLGGKGTFYDDSKAFVTEDGNYVSARWPGDAYLYAKTLIAKIYEQEGKTPNKNNFDTETDISTDEAEKGLEKDEEKRTSTNGAEPIGETEDIFKA